MKLPITIVSGLPRSGTSLVMQMLAAGGVEPVTDGQREADDDNPRGYLELEAVKRTKDDPSWVAEARGKAVKVISHLLPILPTTETYRVLFVERDLEEVLASQAKMIKRRRMRAPDETVVRNAFKAHLAAFDHLTATRSDWSVLRLRHSAIIADPATAAEEIASFLGVPESETSRVEAMAAAVDPTLYRNRSGS